MISGLSLLWSASIAVTAWAQAQPAAPAASVKAEAAKIWPIEAFAKLPFMEAPQLSPDGTKIATRMAINGVQSLAIIKLEDSEDRVKLLPIGDNDLNWWRWVNNDWLVAGIGSEQTFQTNPIYMRRAISIKADGSKSLMLAKSVAAQNADDLIWVAGDGTPRILLGYQSAIYFDSPGFWESVDEVDVSTGKMINKVAPRQGVMDWYADAAGVVRIGAGYLDAGSTASLLYRPNEKTSFRVVSRADIRKDESLIVPRLFLADPNKALAIDDHEGTRALYELDLTTLALGRKVFDVPGFDISDIRGDPWRDILYGVDYTGDRREMKWMAPELAEVQSDIDKAVAANGRRANILSMNGDHSRFLVKVGAANRAGVIYYYNPAAGQMNLLASVNDVLKDTKLAAVRTIRYKARDGLDISAVLTVPQGKAESNLPLILMPHDGPFRRDAEEWNWVVQFLANRGYAVLQPNYRGSAGYGKAFTEKGEGQWGLAMQDDLDDAVDWAVKQGMVDGKRVCIVGLDYGGYAAMRAVQRSAGLYRCAASYAGVSNLGAMVRYDSRYLNAGKRKDWLKEQAPDFTAVSPVNHAEDFSAPILLMHGRKDLRVPVGQSRLMAEKLKAAGKSYIYVEQPLADHVFSREADRLDFLTRLEAFLREHNPA